MVEFPRASFGKAPGSGAYAVLHRDPVFHQQAQVAKAFQKLCGSFEWRSSSGEEVYQSCFGILQVNDCSVLVARFSDAGRDEAGRPHTLRIDCLLVEATNLAQAWKEIGGSAQAATPEWPHFDGLVIVAGKDSTFVLG